METQHGQGVLSSPEPRPASVRRSPARGHGSRFWRRAAGPAGWSRWGPMAALAALGAAFGLAEPAFLTLDNLRVIADSSAIPVILAVGLTFVVLQGSIDLSSEGVMALCSLSVAMLVLNSRTTLDLGAAALALALLPGLAIGALNGLVVTRLAVPSFMATLGTWSVALGLAMLLSGGQPPLVKDPSLRAFGLGQTATLPNLAIVALAVVAMGHVLQHHTRFGRHGMAIGGGEDLARQAGLAVSRYKLLAFALSGLLAGLGGVLASLRIGLGHVDIGFGQMLATVTAVVIGGASLSGGRGSVVQSAVGAVLLAVLANGMVFVGIPPEAQKAVQGAIILSASLLGAWQLRDRLRNVP
jgi:ribose transport system permease protein